MNVIDALNFRASTRAFKPDPIGKETIVKILEAATRAPSWANTQPWEIFIAAGDSLERIREAFMANLQKGAPRYPELATPHKWPEAMQKRMEALRIERSMAVGIVLEDKDPGREMQEMNARLFGAPLVVYFCIDRTLGPWSILDIGMLAQSIMLAAQEYGLDSMPAVTLVSYPDVIRTELKIPDNLSILFGVALGYRDPQHPQNQYRSSRRPVQEVAHFSGL